MAVVRRSCVSPEKTCGGEAVDALPTHKRSTKYLIHLPHIHSYYKDILPLSSFRLTFNFVPFPDMLLMTPEETRY